MRERINLRGSKIQFRVSIMLRQEMMRAVTASYKSVCALK